RDALGVARHREDLVEHVKIAYAVTVPRQARFFRDVLGIATPVPEGPAVDAADHAERAGVRAAARGRQEVAARHAVISEAETRIPATRHQLERGDGMRVEIFDHSDGRSTTPRARQAVDALEIGMVRDVPGERVDLSAEDTVEERELLEHPVFGAHRAAT